MRIEQGVERQALQAIASEDRAGLVKGLVGGRLTTAQVVIVHGRQVVVHQRIGMDQLDGAGGTIGLLGGRTEGFAGGIGEQRAYALAAVHHAVAHGGVEAGEL
ncbi:hypothetical protein D3C75_994730 [compost metagenome]